MRKRTRGDGQRPRMTIFRSHKHMYVQVIDDEDVAALAESARKAGLSF